MIRSFAASIILCLSFLTNTVLGAPGYLLKSPPLVKPEDFNAQKKGVEMTFEGRVNSTKSRFQLGFRYSADQTYLVVQFEDALPQEFTLSERQKFTKSYGETGVIWSFVYPKPSLDIWKQLTQMKGTVQEEMGMPSKSLVAGEGHPKRITVNTLIPLLKEKHVVFYTGAGISAEIVPTMERLLHKIGVVGGSNPNFLNAIKKAIHTPENLQTYMDKFNKACLYGKPSKAHHSLKNICQRQNWGLLTENVDQLHQSTGIMPLNHMMKDWLTTPISKQDLEKIDVVMTVGLRTDESGFLAWYKQHNPNALIIAVNLQKPNYLSDADYWVQGDIQKIIPELEARL